MTNGEMFVILKRRYFITKEFVKFKCNSVKQLKYMVINVFKIPLEDIESFRVYNGSCTYYRQYEGKDLLKIERIF